MGRCRTKPSLPATGLCEKRMNLRSEWNTFLFFIASEARRAGSGAPSSLANRARISCMSAGRSMPPEHTSLQDPQPTQFWQSCFAIARSWKRYVSTRPMAPMYTWPMRCPPTSLNTGHTFAQAPQRTQRNTCEKTGSFAIRERPLSRNTTWSFLRPVGLFAHGPAPEMKVV